MYRIPRSRLFRLFRWSRFMATALVAPAVAAGSLNPPPAPAIGSTNVAMADLLVSRPGTLPCTVPLFNGFVFADFNEQSFNYMPPTGCPGPWARVVLEADFSVTAGIQYDRSGYFNLGGVNLFFGTTAEPSSDFGPSWHVERDLTDYAPLFLAPQSGAVSLGNLVDSTYTGIIYGSASLQFYPAAGPDPVPPVADAVLPLSSDAVALNDSGSQLSQVLPDLPRNIEHAYLDIIAQSQSNDEFWYTCVPDDVASELFSCGGTSFREVEISVDGQAAGVAPVYPWIYTGGLDPYLWSPIPGVQTLDFLPYRVDLTPFAAQLSDGQPHTVSLSVYNADRYFIAEANLLLYLDRGSTQVTGALTRNTLAPSPSPVVAENLQSGPAGGVHGTVSVTSKRDFTIAGYVQTSHGRVDTTLAQTVNFSSRQRFDVGPLRFIQNIDQLTRVSTVTLTAARGHSTRSEQRFDYPLKIDIAEKVNATQGTQTVSIDQRWISRSLTTAADGSVLTTAISNEVAPTDTLLFDPNSGAITGNQDQSGQQRYRYHDSAGNCYDRILQSQSGAITSVTDGCR